MSQGDLLGSSGPYRARLWGVCNTPLPCRSIVWDHFANRPTLTPHQTSPDKGTNAGVGFGCRVRFWDCGGGGGDVTGPYFGLPRGGDCQYGRYFELLRGID